MHWGDRIEVNGVRPDWHRGEFAAIGQSGRQWGPYTDNPDTGEVRWDQVVAIRLPADHSYYKAVRAGFEYWPGGESAPDDWDGDRDGVLYRDGAKEGRQPFVWRHCNHSADVIGYHKRTNDDTVSVRRMTEAEWAKFISDKLSDFYSPRAGMAVIRELGLIKPEPTEAERIAAQTGVPLPTVQAVLDARSV